MQDRQASVSQVQESQGLVDTNPPRGESAVLLSEPVIAFNLNHHYMP